MSGLAAHRNGPSSGPPRREHVAEIDLLRAISALAVVLIHVTAIPLSMADPASRSMAFYGFWNQWSRFSIPAFVFISGLVLAHVYGNRPVDLRRFYGARIRSIVVPYLAWSLFYWGLRQVLSRNLSPAGLATALAAWPREVALGTAMYHLYFLLLILQFYLLYPLLARTLTPVRIRWALAAALALQLGIHIRSYYVLRPPASPALAALWPWQDRLFPAWIFFFVLGMYAGMNLDRFRQQVRRWLPALGAVTALLLAFMVWEFLAKVRIPGFSVAAAATSLRPSGFLYSVLATALIFGLAGRWPVLVGWTGLLSRHSYGIYLAHPLFLAAAQIGFSRLGVASVHLLYLGYYLVAAGGALALAVLLGRFRLGALLLGRG